jgi:hypothetical protein
MRNRLFLLTAGLAGFACVLVLTLSMLPARREVSLTTLARLTAGMSEADVRAANRRGDGPTAGRLARAGRGTPARVFRTPGYGDGAVRRRRPARPLLCGDPRGFRTGAGSHSPELVVGSIRMRCEFQFRRHTPLSSWQTIGTEYASPFENRCYSVAIVCHEGSVSEQKNAVMHESDATHFS